MDTKASPKSYSRAGVIIARRQMLRGAGGVAIGLPFLPSLVPGRAYGADPSFVRQPRFVSITTDHGGIFEAAMYPADAVLTEATEIAPGHTVRSGPLARAVMGGEAVVAGVLRGPVNRLSERLVGKMNVIRGLDIPFYIAHNTGGHLGNYARNDGNGSEGKAIQGQPMPTIDQLMAWSPSFYRDLTGNKLRSIVTGPRTGISWGFSSPSSRSGSIVGIASNNNPSSLFDKLFIPGEASRPTDAPRPPVVDKILEQYRSLRQSNRRLSARDRQRLDDHIEKLAEVQRRLRGSRNSVAACRDVKKPVAASGAPGFHAALNDVIAMGLICGATRIAVIGCQESQFASSSGNWHQGVAHQWNGAGQPHLQEAARGIFRHVFLDLMAKLDVEESPGVTVLDNTLMAWSQESGQETHDNRSMPLVTAGSAAGFLRTGLYVDYRNPSARLKSYGKDVGPVGLLWNQWLATALQAMGLQRSEWQGIANNGATGYGHPQMGAGYRAAYGSHVTARASEVLPLLKAG